VLFRSALMKQGSAKILWQSKFNIKTNTNRLHSRSHLLILITKAFYVFAFNFFRDKTAGNQWFLSLTLFFGAALTFLNVRTERPYYDGKTQRVST